MKRWEQRQSDGEKALDKMDVWAWRPANCDSVRLFTGGSFCEKYRTFPVHHGKARLFDEDLARTEHRYVLFVALKENQRSRFSNS